MLSLLELRTRIDAGLGTIIHADQLSLNKLILSPVDEMLIFNGTMILALFNR